MENIQNPGFTFDIEHVRFWLVNIESLYMHVSAGACTQKAYKTIIASDMHI